MSMYVNTDMKICFHGYDLSGDIRSFSMDLKREEKETPACGYQGKRRLAGMQSMEVSGNGYQEFGTGNVDDTMFSNLGVDERVLSVARTADDGAIGYFSKAVSLNYKIGSPISDVAPFDFAAFSQGVKTVRGTVMATGAKITNGSGTARELGAVSADQYLYAALHVLAASGSGPPQIDVKIQSDSVEEFTSPADRITFTSATDETAQWATPVAGAITDTWWRVIWTVSGSPPNFTIQALVGIL